MQITDPIADMLTRIRNASRAGHESCEVPASRLKQDIANILLDEGYIKAVEKIEDNKQGILKITLKYQQKRSVIAGIRRISKPGLRVYANATDMPQVLGGLGVAVVSTSQGVMTDEQARKAGIGGEVMLFVW